MTKKQNLKGYEYLDFHPNWFKKILPYILCIIVAILYIKTEPKVLNFFDNQIKKAGRVMLYGIPNREIKKLWGICECQGPAEVKERGWWKIFNEYNEVTGTIDIETGTFKRCFKTLSATMDFMNYLINKDGRRADIDNCTVIGIPEGYYAYGVLNDYSSSKARDKKQLYSSNCIQYKTFQTKEELALFDASNFIGIYGNTFYDMKEKQYVIWAMDSSYRNNCGDK